MNMELRKSNEPHSLKRNNARYILIDDEHGLERTKSTAFVETKQCEVYINWRHWQLVKRHIKMINIT
jgi:hypothetical protein